MMNNTRLPFYLSPSLGASLSDISSSALNRFINKARDEREFIFSEKDGIEEVLNQLAIKQGDQLLNAAIMLFGVSPQKFCPNAIIKCSHYYGTELERPIPSHQVFDGTLFQQIDSAVDFVLSRMDRKVSGRQHGPVAEVKSEIPNEVIIEIIVNAVVHRDYDSAASVQIEIFSDRIVIMNPGGLPERLSISDLSKKHLSIPVNPFIARPLYLAGYINQLGYGTQNVFKWCKKAQLPEPVFEQGNGQFSVTLWRNWLTEQKLTEFNLSRRLIEAIDYLKIKGSITNTIYQQQFKVAKRTATKDLQSLVSAGLLLKHGTTGKGVYYYLAKGAPKGHKGH